MCVLITPPLGYSTCGQLYNGFSGIAYFYWRLSRSPFFVDSRHQYLDIAARCVTTSLKDSNLKKTGPTFFVGATGVHALASTIYSDMEDENHAREYANRVITECDVPAGQSHELLSGTTGTISCLLFLLENVPKKYYDAKRVLDIIQNHCLAVVRGGKVNFKSYSGYLYGAAHGLVGILFPLMHNTAFIEQSQYRAIVESSLNELLTKQTDGIFISHSTSEKANSKFHWCHGSPGTVPALIKGHQLFKSPQYLAIAELATEKVWKRGIVWKGANLCHGVCGNTYAFLNMFNYTHNVKYLYYAYQFCLLAGDAEMQCKFASATDASRKKVGSPDHPFSLMEGIAGEGCFYLDMLNPKEAKFPGYAWNDTGRQ